MKIFNPQYESTDRGVQAGRAISFLFNGSRWTHWMGTLAKAMTQTSSSGQMIFGVEIGKIILMRTADHGQAFGDINGFVVFAVVFGVAVSALATWQRLGDQQRAKDEQLVDNVCWTCRPGDGRPLSSTHSKRIRCSRRLPAHHRKGVSEGLW